MLYSWIMLSHFKCGRRYVDFGKIIGAQCSSLGMRELYHFSQKMGKNGGHMYYLRSVRVLCFSHISLPYFYRTTSLADLKVNQANIRIKLLHILKTIPAGIEVHPVAAQTCCFAILERRTTSFTNWWSVLAFWFLENRWCLKNHRHVLLSDDETWTEKCLGWSKCRIPSLNVEQWHVFKKTLMLTCTLSPRPLLWVPFPLIENSSISNSTFFYFHRPHLVFLLLYYIIPPLTCFSQPLLTEQSRFTLQRQSKAF